MRIPRPVLTIAILGLILATLAISYAQAMYRVYLPAVVTQSTGSSIPPTPTPVPPSPTPDPGSNQQWGQIYSNTPGASGIRFSVCGLTQPQGYRNCLYSTLPQSELQARGLQMVAVANGARVTLSAEQLAEWQAYDEALEKAIQEGIAAVKEGLDPLEVIQQIPAPAFPFLFGTFAGSGWALSPLLGTPVGWVIVIVGSVAIVTYIVITHDPMPAPYFGPTDMTGPWPRENATTEARVAGEMALQALNNPSQGSMEDGMSRTGDMGGQPGDPRCKPNLPDNFVVEYTNLGQPGKVALQLLDEGGTSVGFANVTPMTVMYLGQPTQVYQLSTTVISSLGNRHLATMLGRVAADLVAEQVGGSPLMYTVASNQFSTAWRCLTGDRYDVSANGSIWNWVRYDGADRPTNLVIRQKQ